MVKLKEVTVEAADEETAMSAYLDMVRRGDVEVEKYGWELLGEGDLTVKNAGKGKDEPF